MDTALIMKCSLTDEVSRAFLAPEPLLLSMLAYVYSQHLLRGQLCVASFASERLRACMELHVPFSISERKPLTS